MKSSVLDFLWLQLGWKLAAGQRGELPVPAARAPQALAAHQFSRFT